MKHEQVYELVNEAQKEVLGEAAIAELDLANVVDLGETIENMNKVDEYVKSILNRIGREKFVNRVYTPRVPSVLMDSWEFGSIMSKIDGTMPDATVNYTWELESGQSYDPFIFNAPEARQKLFNKRTTFEIDLSFARKQIKQSFTNETELNAFFSMVENEVDKSLTIKNDALIMLVIDNMICETLYDATTSGSVTRAYNLLSLYNATLPEADAIDADEAWTNPEFFRFAALTINTISDRMTEMSVNYNIEGKPRFTPKDLQHIVYLSDFSRRLDSYLMSDTYHNEFVALPKGDIVTKWQGIGKDTDSIADRSKIMIKTASGHDVTATGVVATIFDHDALGVCNYEPTVESIYNPRASFYNNFYKRDAGYFNDLQENAVVFYIADAS